MVKQLVITVDSRETRVAVLEDGRLAEFYTERHDDRSLVGNIYKGRVENVLAGMDAAFVNTGLEKNGFLYVDEVALPEDSDSRPRKITQLLKPGQELTVQVTKDPMGSKGARLTTQTSIAGRYLVYIPDGRMCGVSRSLPDEERQRLRRLCREIKPEEAGVIVRTAAEGVGRDALARDLNFLDRLWKTVRGRIESSSPPAMVYAEAELAMKIVRDIYGEDFSQILVDDPELRDRIVGFLQATAPELADTVELYEGAKPPFETYGIENEIRKALRRRVDLPSGGYLVVDFTEALTVIDVNTGRYVGRKRLEDTILKTNLEAVREVVRQLRVRDVGGIIVIDFIDMARKDNREQVLAALDEELAKDRTKTYVVELSPLGLVEMTRQNVTDGLRGIMTDRCPTCGGDGVVLSDETRAIDIERRLYRLAESAEAEAFIVEVNPQVAAVLLAYDEERIRRLEKDTGKLFIFEGVEYLGPDAYRISAEGSRDVIQRASLPVSEGEQLELEIEETHAYNRADGVARIDGYVVEVAGAGRDVGKKVRVVVESAGRHCARAHVVLEEGS